MLKAVIYDLDGTLIDSRADLADAVNAMLLRLGLPLRPEAEVAGFVGEGAQLLVRRSLGAAQEHRLDEAMPIWFACYGERLVARTQLYPGIAEVLRLPPARRAVLTNKPGGFAREIVRLLGIEPFVARTVGGDDAPKKPDPGALLALCRELGASPAEALLVGDSRVDVETGRAGGVSVCAVSWGFDARERLLAAGPAHLCDSVPQLGLLLQRLAAGP